MKQHSINFILVFLAVFLVGGLFALDFNTPATLASGALFAIAVLYSWLLPWKQSVFVTALLCSVLSIYSFSQKESLNTEQNLVILNVALSMLAIWTCAFALIIGKRSLDSLESANETLEAQVQLRTKDLKMSEERLRESEQLYRYLYEYSNEILFILDLDALKINNVNHTFLLRLGYEKNEIESAHLTKIVHQDSLNEVNSNLEKLNKREKLENLEIKVSNGNGQIRIMNFQAIPLIKNDGNFAFCSLIDITDQITYQLKIEAQNRMLQNKNTELEQFAYIASHDLQEPLRTASSFTDLVLEEYGPNLDDRAVDFLKRVIVSNGRMKELITGLLHYSRIGKHQQDEAVDLNEIVSEIQADLQLKIEETEASIVLDKLPVINGSSVELRMVLQNLITNALKFCKANTKPKIEIGMKLGKNTFDIFVKDNGIGIDKDWHDKIFMIFQRLHTNDQYPGTGIGLAQVHKIVLMHEGEVLVDSSEGAGSTFTIRFPLSKMIAEKSLS